MNDIHIHIEKRHSFEFELVLLATASVKTQRYICMLNL